MSATYFGTDGIRGVVDKNLNFALAYEVGKSLAMNIKQKNLSPKVVIGKDTRLSGDLFCYAVACGLIDYGVDVVMLGIVPTGCVSYLVSRLDVGYGVMITASHNSPDMNGIKVFNNLGYKLSDKEELEVESHIYETSFEKVFYKGKITKSEQLVEKYINYVTSIGGNLHGIRIALDCAYGSNYKIAPVVFKKLGAEVVEINSEPLGEKINVNCGALNTSELKREVARHKCHIGFAFDGDADRLIVVTPDGKELAGDEMLYIFAQYLIANDKLNSLRVVGTVMTNLGCEESLNELGIKLIRTDVGDKNVIEKMRDNNFSLGGESSGHICFHSYNTTCDALINAIKFLHIIENNFDNIHAMLLRLKKYNQILKNVKVSDEFRKGYNENNEFLQGLSDIISQISGVKIVVRPSGTESLIRILVESGDAIKNEKALVSIEKYIKNYIKKNYE